MFDSEKNVSPLEKLSYDVFKRHTMPVSNLLYVLDGPTQILQNNPNRVYTLIQNIGVDDIYLGFDNMVGYGHGIRLFAQGGAVSLDFRTDGETVGYELFGICDLEHTGIVYVYAVNVI